MFESEARLRQDVERLLEVMRSQAGARHACLVDKGAVLFESAEPEAPAWAFRRFLEARLHALFELPAGMAADGPSHDVFEDWEQDDFLLAFVNSKVALVLACADAEAARQRIEATLPTLVDRLLRLRPGFRLDESGRGFLFGRPRVDWIVVSGPAPEA